MVRLFRKKRELSKQEKFDKFLLHNNKKEEKSIPLRQIKEPGRLAFKRNTDNQILQFHEIEEVPDLKFPERKGKMPKLVEYNPEKIILQNEVKPEIREVNLKSSDRSSLDTSHVMKSPDEQRLESFVKMALAKGYDKEQIRAGLIAKGWPEKIVDKVLWRKI